MSEETQTETEKEEVTSVPASSKKKMALWKKILIGVGGFILLIIILASWATADLSKVAEKEFNLLRSGDLQGAYALTSAGFQKETSFEGFKTFLNQYPILKDNTSSSIDEKTRENGMGSVKGTVKNKDGVTSPFELQLIQEGSDWKILGIKLPASTGTTPEPQAQSTNSNTNSFSKVANGDNSSLDGSFQDEGLGFALNYPSTWTKQQKDFMFMLTSPKNADGSEVSVLIQKIGTKALKADSKYTDVDDLVKKMGNIFKTQYKGAKLEAPTEIVYTKADGTTLKGKQFKIEYEYEKTKFKDWQVAIPANQEGTIIYTWEYIAPADQYDKNITTVSSMFNSWKIN